MKRKRHILGVLTAMALLMMHLPVSEADAEASASDFQIEGDTLVRYQGRDRNVIIPDSVKQIGRGAFDENPYIQQVIIPDSVEEIAPYAFWGCENLAGVGIGSGLNWVDDYAFAGSGLKQVVLPANIIGIGVRAFEDCSGLTDITIPAETSDIHESAFDGCYQLTIHYKRGSAAEAYAADFAERQKEMQAADQQEESPKEMDSVSIEVIPSPTPTEQPSPSPKADTVVTTGRELGSTSIVGNRAVVMVQNTSLSVYGKEAAGLPGESLDWTDEEARIPKYRIIDGRVVADQAYYRDSSLGEVSAPEGIREIGELAYARSSAVSVTLPEGVERIGYGAFYHCDALEKVTLPETVNCVEPEAFSHTPWMEHFLEGDGSDGSGDFLVEGGVLAAYRGNGADVAIPEGVRVIAGEVFQGHDEIRRVSFPDSLRVVGEGAFEACSSLEEVDFGAYVEELKDRAFLGSAISKISIPPSVKKEGLQVFGSAAVTYEGEEPEHTYEPSAAKLSNRENRGVAEETETGSVPGVTVAGLEEIFGALPESFRSGSTELKAADTAYTLTVGFAADEDIAGMKASFGRIFRTALPEGMVFYDLELTDESGIPIRKLGKQTIQIVLPVPEAFKGQELRLFTLDGNGQLTRVRSEAVTVDGVEAFRFDLSDLSVIGVCGV